MALIRIIPVHASLTDFLPAVAIEIAKQLDIPTRIENAEFDPSFSYNPARSQYHSSQLLLALKQMVKNSDEKILAVTDLDLFIPILTFVFGEAQLSGSASVVSTFRLRPEFYGLRQDNILVIERLQKEAIHELGHTFGLLHCPNFQCVLNASTYVEEIDLKAKSLCRNCREILRKTLSNAR